MKNYPISDLKLSDGARNILAQLHITTTDELAGVVMARVSELCGDERNIFKEIDIIVWQLRKQKLIPAEYTPEQLQKMSHRSIDELSLDSKTNYFLKEYNHLYIDQVAQLTAEDYASLDGIGRVRIEEIQKAIKIWILNIMPPEEYQKAFFNPAVVRDGKIVPLYMCQVPLTASILDVMRRHPVKELRLTASAYDIAKDNDVETIGELAVLDYHEIVSKPYRPYRKRSIHDVLDNLFVWIDENMLSFHLVPDDVKDEVMYLHAMEGCARMLEPICKISSGKMYTLFHRDGKLELLDLRENEESTFYNYQLALSLDGLKKTFCSLWDTILPDNVDYTDRVELKLHEMNITGVTEFVDAS